MRIDITHVQSKCTKSIRTLTKLEDQMSQLMSMMGDIKSQIDTGILSNTENNPRREGNEYVKAIVLRLGKLLNSLENPTPEVNLENANDPQEKSVEAEDELEQDEEEKAHESKEEGEDEEEEGDEEMDFEENN
ncbi:acidic leucine-rich nuclear phosphoprotein 32 family member B-like [Gossypium hirsutum]|uniref:Acidic leucine-rich nuclear phosphoprotein 32 family member B-like n=1 Tax=Gossypium hirsutum TaxID=3635 RepID=A0A1U8NG84_GOSHI|nr:acidic leucine-rich nuclear phosphoprotein 32 family member B-like [Gossypium hirsutum]